MNTYAGKELDEKIHTFLTKRTQRFPELQSRKPIEQSDKYENRLINSLEKASVLWTQYIHA